MQPMYYIGLDVHKQKISYGVKDGGGKVFAEGWIPATRCDFRSLDEDPATAVECHDVPGWIYDHLKPHAAALKVEQQSNHERNCPTLVDRTACSMSSLRTCLRIKRLERCDNDELDLRARFAAKKIRTYKTSHATRSEKDCGAQERRVRFGSAHSCHMRAIT